VGSEFVKELVRYTAPRPIRNWLGSPAQSFEWIADNALFALGVAKRLRLSHNVNVILHPHAFKIGRGQIEDPKQRAQFDNFISIVECSFLILAHIMGYLAWRRLN
jgi:hypothetical protein